MESASRLSWLERSSGHERETPDHAIRMSPDSSRKPEPFIFLKLKFLTLVYYSCGLPLVAMATCVILSILKDFESSTSTHCGVTNILPSISASIGGYAPQRYIWRLLIGAHCAPRLLVSIIYRNYFKSFPLRYNKLYMLAVNTMSLLHFVEVVSLMVLSAVSSTENFTIHEFSFVSFMICSETYMILQLVLFRWARDWKQLQDSMVKKSFHHKRFFLISNLSAFCLCLFFYWRHNTYCEPGVYSLFALCEYIVVTSNILYHGTIRLDFPDGDAYMVYSVSKMSLR